MPISNAHAELPKSFSASYLIPRLPDLRSALQSYIDASEDRACGQVHIVELVRAAIGVCSGPESDEILEHLRTLGVAQHSPESEQERSRIASVLCNTDVRDLCAVHASGVSAEAWGEVEKTDPERNDAYRRLVDAVFEKLREFLCPK